MSVNPTGGSPTGADGKAVFGVTTASTRGAVFGPTASSVEARTAKAALRVLSGAPAAPSPALEPGTVLRSVPPGERVAVKDDGDCLYSSLAEGMKEHEGYLKSNGLIAGPLTVIELRAEISHTMELLFHEDAEFFGGVIAGANEQFDRQIEELQQNRDLLAGELPAEDLAHIDAEIRALEANRIKSPEDYIARVKEKGFWGGEIEIKAFARRFGMNVKVFEVAADGAIVDRGLPLIPAEKTGAPTIYLVASARHYDYYKRAKKSAAMRLDVPAVVMPGWMAPPTTHTYLKTPTAPPMPLPARKEEAPVVLPPHLSGAAHGGAGKEVIRPSRGASSTVGLPPLIKGDVTVLEKSGDSLFKALEEGLKEFSSRKDIGSKILRSEISDTLTANAASPSLKPLYDKAIAAANAQPMAHITSMKETKAALETVDDPALLGELAGQIRSLDEQIKGLESTLIRTPKEYNAQIKGQGFPGGELELIAFAKRYNMNVQIVKQGPRGVEISGPPYVPDAANLARLGITDAPTIYLMDFGKYYGYFHPTS